MIDFTTLGIWPWLPIGAGLTGGIAALIARLVSNRGTLDAVVSIIEGTVYGALGALGGIFAALVGLYLLPATFFSLLFAAFAVLCAVGIVLGLIHGTAGAIGKVLGTVMYVVLAAGFIVAARFSWTDNEQMIVTWFASIWAVSGALMGLTFATYRSLHLAAGWLISFWNASWGFIGNMLGNLLNIGSWFYFAGSSTTRPGDRELLPSGERHFFHCWRNGMRILGNYYFSQGPVMTAWTKQGMWHEAVHVLQHYILGPMMPIGYVTWSILGAIGGAIAGLISGNGIAHGAFAWAYVNNPFEVMEYESKLGGVGSTTRQVSRDVVVDGKQSTDLIPSGTVAWTYTVLWMLGLVGAFILLIVVA
ncbi:MAG: hypothetical protein AAF513_00845 [Pseudomonadota bacterium]